MFQAISWRLSDAYGIGLPCATCDRRAVDVQRRQDASHRRIPTFEGRVVPKRLPARFPSGMGAGGARV